MFCIVKKIAMLPKKYIMTFGMFGCVEIKRERKRCRVRREMSWWNITGGVVVAQCETDKSTVSFVANF